MSLLATPHHTTLLTLLLLLSTSLKAQHPRRRPPGISNEAWTSTLEFEKDCHTCRTCSQANFGFNKYKKPFAPTNGVPNHWLHIVVGSIPRRSSTLSTNYLTQLLDSVRDQLTLPGVHLTIFNHRPGKHIEFSRLKKKYQTSLVVSFIDLHANTCDPQQPDGWSFHAGLSPMLRARQQTRDVVNMMVQVQDTSRFVLLVEDDFIFCPQSLTALYHKIIFTQQFVHFSAMRFGVGLSGILLWSSDIPLFSQYLVETQHNMPVDLLATEWFLAAMPIQKYRTMKRRPYLINKETLVSHIGDVSSFNDKRGMRKTAKCGQRVRVRSFFESKESYQANCDKVTVSPCVNFPDKHILKLKQHGAVRPDDIPRTSRVVMAPAGQNCDDGCRALGLSGFNQCAASEINKLSSCGLVKRYMPKCNACVVKEQVNAQAHGSDDEGYVCNVPTFKTSTSVKHCRQSPQSPSWQRICVCHSYEAQMESNKIFAEKPKK
jgi:hypothetical protein|tara:strand:+ start:279 stop:1739 length:1461 start_codon:yes stop_codon:yes gene_type:complete